MNKILILGGTGLLGAPVARRLQADGFEVRLLARDREKARAMFDESFEIVAGDLFEAHSAGPEPKGINPYTVRVMEEIGFSPRRAPLPASDRAHEQGALWLHDHRLCRRR